MDKKLVNITHSESRLCIARNMKSQVIEFLSRDDNSRSQPGKADAKKTESGEKQQTRVLTDYVGNLYDKFLSENPGTKLSKTTFQRLRPNNILLTSFISRNTCQCVHHQNMALKIQSLRKLGIRIGQNLEHLIARQDELDNILENLPENVNFKTWKKVESEGKMRMKLKRVDLRSSTNTFRRIPFSVSHHFPEDVLASNEHHDFFMDSTFSSSIVFEQCPSHTLGEMTFVTIWPVDESNVLKEGARRVRLVRMALPDTLRCLLVNVSSLMPLIERHNNIANAKEIAREEWLSIIYTVGLEEVTLIGKTTNK
ncbi:hypothetical protein MAR_030999 [Mya arenaria]|uniref:Uncharacterized protein n=1 Tax=Mya arenaria TaxID=6604 RepID=A0ABY7F3S0_MYAAR|nr:hypothetical protein MAR_030999 [Mya arenaria]